MVYTVYLMKKKPAERQEPTRDRLLDAARTLFDQEGLDGLSMRRIADAVGLTPMAIYKHYANKDALVDALMLDGFAVWEARARAIKARDPVAWLEKLVAAFLDFALNEPRRYEAAFLLSASGARRYPDDFLAGRSPVISMAYMRIKEAQAVGLINDTPAGEIALSLAALGQGLVSMYRADRFVGEGEFRDAYRRTMRRCFASFLIQPME